LATRRREGSKYRFRTGFSDVSEVQNASREKNSGGQLALTENGRRAKCTAQTDHAEERREGG
jgi:hypothetical protein